MKLAWKQLVITFLLGTVVWWAGNQWYAPHFHHRHWGEHWGNPEHPQKRMLERFKSELNLTPEQQQRVAAILEEKRSKIDTLRVQMRPKFEEIRNATQAEIRPFLTPEQQKKFDAMVAEHEARAKRLRGRWNSGEAAGQSKDGRTDE